MIVASRAVDKRAAARNRLRRRVREYIRTRSLSSLSAAPSRDIAVIIQRQAASATRNDFYDALKYILARVP